MTTPSVLDKSTLAFDSAKATFCQSSVRGKYIDVINLYTVRADDLLAAAATATKGTGVQSFAVHPFQSAAPLEDIEVRCTKMRALLHGVSYGEPASAVAAVGRRVSVVYERSGGYIGGGGGSDRSTATVEGTLMEPLTSESYGSVNSLNIRDDTTGETTYLRGINIHSVRPLERAPLRPNTLLVRFSNAKLSDQQAYLQVRFPELTMKWDVSYDVTLDSASAMSLRCLLRVVNPYPFSLSYASFTLVEDRPGATGTRRVVFKKQEAAYAQAAPRSAPSYRRGDDGDDQSSRNTEVTTYSGASDDGLLLDRSAGSGVAVRNFDIALFVDALSPTCLPLFEVSSADRVSLHAYGECKSPVSGGSSSNDAIEQTWAPFALRTIVAWKKADLAAGAFLFSGTAAFWLRVNKDTRLPLGTQTLSGWPKDDFYRMDFGDTGVVTCRWRVAPATHSRDTKNSEGRYELEFEASNALLFDIDAVFHVELPRYKALTVVPEPVSRSVTMSMVPQYPDQPVRSNVITVRLPLTAATAAGVPSKRNFGLKVVYNL